VNRYEKAGFFQTMTDEVGRGFQWPAGYKASDLEHRWLAQAVLTVHHIRLTTPLKNLTNEHFEPVPYFPTTHTGEEVMNLVTKLKENPEYSGMSLQGILLKFLEMANAFDRSNAVGDLGKLRVRWEEYMLTVNRDLTETVELIVDQSDNILLADGSRREKRLVYENDKVFHSVVSLMSPSTHPGVAEVLKEGGNHTRELPAVTTHELPQHYFFV